MSRLLEQCPSNKCIEDLLREGEKLFMKRQLTAMQKKIELQLTNMNSLSRRITDEAGKNVLSIYCYLLLLSFILFQTVASGGVPSDLNSLQKKRLLEVCVSSTTKQQAPCLCLSSVCLLKMPKVVLQFDDGSAVVQWSRGSGRIGRRRTRTRTGTWWRRGMM